MVNVNLLGAIIIFFFFFFDKIYKNPFVEKAFYQVCGDKLISDGYCDMNLYISNKISKDSMQQMLKKIDSPFIELYKEGYPKKDNIEDSLNEFLKSKIMKNYEKTNIMKLEDAQALINWIYKSLGNGDARVEATKELMQLLKEKYQLIKQLSFQKLMMWLIILKINIVFNAKR